MVLPYLICQAEGLHATITICLVISNQVYSRVNCQWIIQGNGLSERGQTGGIPLLRPRQALCPICQSLTLRLFIVKQKHSGLSWVRWTSKTPTSMVRLQGACHLHVTANQQHQNTSHARTFLSTYPINLWVRSWGWNMGYPLTHHRYLVVAPTIKSGFDVLSIQTRRALY